jgi:hypothetical protein
MRKYLVGVWISGIVSIIGCQSCTKDQLRSDTLIVEKRLEACVVQCLEVMSCIAQKDSDCAARSALRLISCLATAPAKTPNDSPTGNAAPPVPVTSVWTDNNNTVISMLTGNPSMNQNDNDRRYVEWGSGGTSRLLPQERKSISDACDEEGPPYRSLFPAHCASGTVMLGIDGFTLWLNTSGGNFIIGELVSPPAVTDPRYGDFLKARDTKAYERWLLATTHPNLS